MSASAQLCMTSAKQPGQLRFPRLSSAFVSESAHLSCYHTRMPTSSRIQPRSTAGVPPPVVTSVEKKPSLVQRLVIFALNHGPRAWHRIGVLPGLAVLVVRRILLQSLNLLPTPVQPDSPSGELQGHRTPTGEGNTPGVSIAGAANTPFGRNMPADVPAAARDPAGAPAVQVVAQRLLTRKELSSADGQFNMLAATWIQAMVHDWMNHINDPNPDAMVELSNGPPGCPLAAFRLRRTQPRKQDDLYDNSRTHWWDASFVYGQSEQSVRDLRTGTGGLVKCSSPDQRLGDIANSWAGVTLLQKLFQEEHNAVAKRIAKEHPELSDDDESLFNVARLVVAGVVAKVHTVDWTVELLKTDLLNVGMHSNWYGLAQALGLPSWLSNLNPPNLFGLVGRSEPENHGVPFSLTEEFVSVYRMHPLLPDWLPIGEDHVTMDRLVGKEGDEIIYQPGMKVQLWDALVTYPCGSLTLFNYPSFLRSVTPTENDGEPLPDKIDLAAVDLYRDRERGVCRFNEFRRRLHLNPYRDWHHLTGGSRDMVQALSDVYGEDGIERCDLMIGNLAEAKIPGFAISETAFIIFLVMASRRLEADRFLTSDYSEKTYTKTGLAWVNSTSSMRDVIARHMPNLASKFSLKGSAFTPLGVWPK
jgi:alpha-dioxygenase